MPPTIRSPYRTSISGADVLTWKASTGTRIRVLVADPGSAAVGLRAAELSLAWLPQRCQSTLDYLRRVKGISLRPHGASHYASLFRFDDLLLANTHAYGIWACHSPVLQVHKTSSVGLFDFYTASFDRTWRRSNPACAQTTSDESPTPTALPNETRHP